MVLRPGSRKIQLMNPTQFQRSFETIALAIHWLVRHQEEQPSLSDLANELQLSEAHTQKTFQRFTGVSPKQFLKFLTRQHALQRLKDGQTVLETAWSSGLTGPGRLHDLLISTDALTPGEARRQGNGVNMNWGTGPSPFGPALVAWTARGISFLAFIQDKPAPEIYEQLCHQWPDARFIEQEIQAKQQLEHIFGQSIHEPIKIWLRGSPFQLKVWEALLSIPPGTHLSYANVAGVIGNRGAARATGSAIGRNPVAWLIPCHRVITGLGQWGGYRWGLDTKQAMVATEAAWKQAYPV